jgi:drug/metabolite transporter (DMT)-like permease
VDIFLDKKEDSIARKSRVPVCFVSIIIRNCRPSLLFVYRIDENYSSNAGVILGSVPLFTSIFAVWMLKERLTLIRIIGIILGLIGVSVIVLTGGQTFI